MSESQFAGNHFLNPWRTIGWGLAAALLALPAISMQFTREVDWGLADFIAMGIMIGSVGLGLELAVRASRNNAYRAGASLALLTGFLVTWSNLAVGIIGNEAHPANLMFFGVVGIALAGGFLARFRPAGMSRAMTAAGIAQFVVPPIAIATWSPPVTSDLTKSIAFNTVFAVMWLAAAWLFRRAEK